MAVSIATPLAATSIHTKQMHTAAHSCPTCGTDVVLESDQDDAQRQIRELQAQVEMLKEKATAAVDRCADYEDQLRNIRKNSETPTASDRLSHEDVRPSTAGSAPASAKQSRFSFLTGRRGSPAQAQLSPSHPPPPPTPSDPELYEQLEKERSLRAKAEDRARKVDIEIEELSVQLFSQANEMVATERKARAKLEARVEQLEQKDKEKMARLERLEKAVSRIDRVKAMLAAPPAAVGPRRA